MKSHEGIDVCGRCEISKLQPNYQTPTQQHVYSRRKRDLGHIMKRSVTRHGVNGSTVGGYECPCEIAEERDACGVCKLIGNKESNGSYECNK